MADHKLQAGDRAPAFTLPDEFDKQVKLSDFRGKRVVLYFYPEDDTSGCTAQACLFRDHYDEIEEQNAVVIGISPDDAKSHKKFRSKYNLPFILLCDTDHSVADLYGVWGDKESFGRTFKGIIRSQFIIDEKGKLVDVRYKVPAKESPGLALETLAAA